MIQYNYHGSNKLKFKTESDKQPERMISIHSSSPPNRYQMYINVKSLKSSKALNNFNNNLNIIEEETWNNQNWKLQ